MSRRAQVPPTRLIVILSLASAAERHESVFVFVVAVAFFSVIPEGNLFLFSSAQRQSRHPEPSAAQPKELRLLLSLPLHSFLSFPKAICRSPFPIH